MVDAVRKRAARRAIRAFYIWGQAQYQQHTITRESDLVHLFGDQDVRHVKSQLNASRAYRSQRDQTNTARRQGMVIPDVYIPTTHRTHKQRTWRQAAISRLRVFSYNAESLCRAGRLQEIAEYTGRKGYHVVSIQGTNLKQPTDQGAQHGVTM